jgi:hypothetical protein
MSEPERDPAVEVWRDALRGLEDRLMADDLAAFAEVIDVDAPIDLWPVEDPCQHESATGAEGPVRDMGRMPIRWKCDGCGVVFWSLRKKKILR